MRPLLNKFIFFILLSAGSGASAYELDNNLLAEFRPLKESDWSYQKAAHLLERAGFGGTPSQIHKLLEVSPEEILELLVRWAVLIAFGSLDSHLVASVVVPPQVPKPFFDVH